MTRRQYFVALLVMAVSGLVGGGLVTWLLPGRAAYAQADGVARVIRAERFVLVDAAGKERAALEFTDVDDQPSLTLTDSDGQVRAQLCLMPLGRPHLVFFEEAGAMKASLGLCPITGDPGLALMRDGGGPGAVFDLGMMGLPLGFGMMSGPRVVLFDDESEAAAMLSLADGDPRLRLLDAAGQGRAGLSLIDGAPGLTLFDDESEAAAVLSLFDGDPWLTLVDDEGNIRAALSVMDEGNPGLALYDEAGNWRAALSLADGEPGLALSDAAGQPRVVLGATEMEHTITGATRRHPISTISLFDETGRLTWQAP